MCVMKLPPATESGEFSTVARSHPGLVVPDLITPAEYCGGAMMGGAVARVGGRSGPGPRAAA